MESIKRKFHSVLELAMRLDGEPRKYGTDTMLTGTEIHLIELIGDNENASVTEIAKLFGLTKGAISQRLKQLEQKGVVNKGVDPENASRSVISLTSKGKAAYYTHKHWHETMDGGFEQYFKTLGPEKVAVIDEFLTKAEDFYLKLLSSE